MTATKNSAFSGAGLQEAIPGSDRFKDKSLELDRLTGRSDHQPGAPSPSDNATKKSTTAAKTLTAAEMVQAEADAAALGAAVRDRASRLATDVIDLLRTVSTAEQFGLLANLLRDEIADIERASISSCKMKKKTRYQERRSEHRAEVAVHNRRRWKRRQH